mgnify:CR=1 FL=1
MIVANVGNLTHDVDAPVGLRVRVEPLAQLRRHLAREAQRHAMPRRLQCHLSTVGQLKAMIDESGQSELRPAEMRLLVRDEVLEEFAADKPSAPAFASSSITRF